ncbi:MAG TPA: YciI family protein [Solirubrobacteraceae bacterium]|jgi:hypothetical protein|nr:YciI family protein [Solirubrobacteraceae bacterium]
MSDPETHLLLYTYVEDMADRRGPYRDAHLERIRAEKDAGRVIMAGALGRPPTGGAIVWQGVPREEIERFAAADPYVEAGLVTSHHIEPWTLV